LRWGLPTFLFKYMAYQPRTDFTVALAQIAAERGIDPNVVIDTLKQAMVAAYKRDAREHGTEIAEEEQFEVVVDNITGEVKIFHQENDKKVEVTPPGFGRIAAQTAKQVILQKIREAEKGAILDEYSHRLGTLVSGMIMRFDGPNIVVDIGKAEAVMPSSEQVRSESYHLNQRMTFYVDSIQEGPRGQQIIVSRAASGLVANLFKREVPEINSGVVEITLIAREPGGRTKIAVSSKQSGVDPVGSCVGQKGVRVQEVIEELNGEKIDIIQYSENLEKFIASALSPAQGVNVKLNEKDKTAVVTVPDDQLSLAIGKDGQNVRLAAKLTGFKIDIVGENAQAEKAKEAKEEAKKEVKKDSSSAKASKDKKKVAKKEVKKTKKTEEKVKEIKEDTGEK
jgi:transcription termination/antitermination protein NusA